MMQMVCLDQQELKASFKRARMLIMKYGPDHGCAAYITPELLIVTTHVRVCVCVSTCLFLHLSVCHYFSVMVMDIQR